MALAIGITVVAAYLLGNLNGAVIISKLLAKDDVRRHGSGNAGLTNFYRNYGGSLALLVIVIDMAKAAAACLIGKALLAPFGMEVDGKLLGGLCVSLGHNFPALMGFRGGKGILSGGTVAIVTDGVGAAIVWGLFLVGYSLTKYVSLGSVMAAASFAVYFGIRYRSHPLAMVCGIAIGLLALFMHRENIKRLLRGEERKTYLFKKKGDAK